MTCGGFDDEKENLMKYKLLALDMDGTVLNGKKEISEKTLQAIRQAMELGVIVTIATGRSWQALEQYPELLELIEPPIIVYNGGMVISTDGKDILFRQNLSEKAALEVIGHGRANGVIQYVWSDETLYVDGSLAQIERYISEVGTKYTILEDPEPLAKQGITKVLWSGEPDEIAKYQEMLPGVIEAKDMHYFTSSPWYLEFMDHRISKGATLARFAEHFEIKPEEVIAVGDGMNDVTMLQYAGLGVAMANGAEELKQIADFITGTNEEDGVAQVIEQFIVSAS